MLKQCWSNVLQALQMVGQHYASIGPIYRVIWVHSLSHDSGRRHPHGLCWRCRKMGIMWGKWANAGLLLGHRQRCWTNIKATLVTRPVGAVEVVVGNDDEMVALRFFIVGQS